MPAKFRRLLKSGKFPIASPRPWFFSPSERTSSPEGVGEVDHGRHGDRQLRAGEVEAVAREEVQGPAEERDLNK